MSGPGFGTYGAGDILDDAYQILGILGRGGMATVYEGRALEGGPLVAIKLILPSAEDPSELRRRFFNELVLATRVRHPRIVEVYDFGVSADEAPFIVMERLEGRTLGEELRRNGPLGARRGVPLLIDALDGLAAAHAGGIAHADLKPSNLFLCGPGAEGEALTLLDFGVAHRTAAVRRADWGGTPQYAPPELIGGAGPSARADVYQMGLVLAEVLTGEPVVRARDLRQARAALAAGPLRFSASVTGSAFHDVVRTATRLDPADRFPDAAALRDELVRAYARSRLGEARFAADFGPPSFEDSPTVRYEPDSELDVSQSAESLAPAFVDGTPPPAAIAAVPAARRPTLSPGAVVALASVAASAVLFVVAVCAAVAVFAGLL